MPTAQIEQVLNLFNVTVVLIVGLLVLRILRKQFPFLDRIATNERFVRWQGIFEWIFGGYLFLYAFVYEYFTYIGWASKGVPLIDMRTINPTNSGHFLALAVVFAVGFIFWIHPKPSLTRLIILVLGWLGYHELSWNLAYLPTCITVPAGLSNAGSYVCGWQFFIANDFQNVYVQATIVFTVYVAAFCLFYPREFKSTLKYLPLWIGFMALWLIAGFHITIDSRLNPAWASIYFGNPDVDLTENLSWYLFGYCMLKGYLDVHPLRENVLYQYLKNVGKYRYKGQFVA